MMPLYPLIHPYDQGLLDVGDGNHVYWEVSGNPDGKPALVVHGGPGAGSSAGARRFFDPARYRIILFDQRGCGRSTPHASDPATDMRHNTTHHLISDMEQLRRHLGIDEWLLYGRSWGSTLIVAYAERYPERVNAIVIASVTLSRRSELDWLYRGAGRFFPAELAKFRAAAGLAAGGLVTAAPDAGASGVEVAAAYARLLEHPDPAVREQAANAWSSWEYTVLSLEANGVPGGYTGHPSPSQFALARIGAHYGAHGAWLPDGALLRDAGRLAGIPGVLIHGRLDLTGPPENAWALASAWPDAELVLVEDSGHLGSETMLNHICHALTAFAWN